MGNYSFAMNKIPGAEACPALVLNADYRPLSYFPLSIWHWQSALKAAFMERVDIIAQYDREVHSPNVTLKLPSVIALRKFIKPPAKPAFTRFNLFLRDAFTCQYCGHRDDLTYDHVMPRRLGGRTTWQNIATACAPCNLRKGGRTLEQSGMHLRAHPRQPGSYELQEIGRSFPPNYLHDSWSDYLYWDAELEA